MGVGSPLLYEWSMMNFPHLSDTDFPNLDNVNVYAYKNEFDYSRWAVGTSIKLCNVLWNSDYNDVVKFDTNLARDKWFDDLDDYYSITLKSAINYVPESALKIPIPYDVAARFNYMVVTLPVLPGTNPPINYEDSEIGMRRWYFFIDTIDYRSANATACRLSLDVWTQYQNDIELHYMMLERGHAPVAFSNVDEYLANPIANNDYLLAPDATPSDAEIVRSSTFIPFGNGVKYVCFASTCPSYELSQMGTVLHNIPEYSWSNLTYTDVDVRHGYQLQVNGFHVGNGDDYTYLNTRNQPFARSQNFIPNGTYMYAIDAVSAQSFIDKMMDDCPVFFRTVLACFMVDENMLQFGNGINLYGFTLHECKGRSETLDIKLTKDMFDYPEEYQHLAKLYTFPYSSIELTDNVGETVTVRIENTGNITAHKDAMLAYPFLDARIWFDGINGAGSQSYMWVDMNGSPQMKQMPNSDWSKACFDLSIPCYALYMDADKAWYLDNFATTIKGNGYRVLAGYHNAVRSANTARANAIDSNNTMYANADRSAATLVTNTENSINCNRSNADLTIAANTTNTNNSNTASENAYNYNKSAAERKTSASNRLSAASTNINQETTAATNVNTAACSGWQSAVGNAMSAAAMGGAAGSILGPEGTAGGALIGFVGGLIDGVMGVYNAESNGAILLGAAQSVVSITGDTNHELTNISNGAAQNCMEEDNRLRTRTNTTNNNAFSAQTNNTNNMLRTNAGNNAATMRANANATRNTGNANAGYTREIGVLNAKETLESTRQGVQNELNAAKMGAPVQLTQSDGNYLSQYMGNNGVQFKVRTMPNGDVRQIGDTFLRYGYALNQMWDIDKSGLCPMPHFCYWRASDIWVDDRASSNNAVQDAIIRIFRNGVTVWRDPMEIGKVAIYDNR